MLSWTVSRASTDRHLVRGDGRLVEGCADEGNDAPPVGGKEKGVMVEHGEQEHDADNQRIVEPHLDASWGHYGPAYERNVHVPSVIVVHATKV